jgi:hypothetical protein
LIAGKLSRRRRESVYVSVAVLNRSRDTCGNFAKSAPCGE